MNLLDKLKDGGEKRLSLSELKQALVSLKIIGLDLTDAHARVSAEIRKKERKELPK